MLKEVARIFDMTPKVILAAPIIFLTPVLGEAAQHIAEYHLGMLICSAVVLFAFLMLVGPHLISFVRDSKIGVPDKALPFLPLIALLPLLLWTQLWTQHLNLWWIDNFLGDNSMTLDRSRKLIKGRLNWMTMVVITPVIVPLVIHYQLNYWSMGAEFLEQVSLLTIDSFLVGIIAILLGVSMWVSYDGVLQPDD